ncbi:hypothetical protein ACN28S_64740 [Cystobacter fuscus]
MQADSKRMLGEILMELGLLDRARLRLGLVHHHELGVPLGRALVREGLCTEADVLRALAQQAGFPAIDLDREPLHPKLTRLVSKRVARKYRVIPLRLDKGEREVLHIALPAPASLEALDAVRAVSGKPRVEPYVASDPAISRALFALYRFQEQAEPPVNQPTPERGSDAPVLLYAWPPVTATLISRSLAREGIRTRVISPLETLHTTASDLGVRPRAGHGGTARGRGAHRRHAAARGLLGRRGPRAGAPHRRQGVRGQSARRLHGAAGHPPAAPPDRRGLGRPGLGVTLTRC